jgi:hypothetical protein
MVKSGSRMDFNRRRDRGDLSIYVENGRDRSDFIYGTVTTVPYKKSLLSSLYQREGPIFSNVCRSYHLEVQ